ncbi:SDR family oxidoreductase [Tomitella biformata]|uniref:SDR family oxidoreductase n=1 Tax=Tomitella biformata TaxID=630403 RepID=UPI000463C184|nr:SDR family oxidoreductase [Tomitella biformata]
MPTPSVVITGAASGIGRATALLFARSGYRVGAFDVDETGLASLAKESAKSGRQISTGILDVTDADAWQTRLAEFTEPDDGRLTILINNAGLLSSGRFADVPLAAQQRMVDVNVLGTLNGCHTAFPYLKGTPNAQVVNLCSASAIYGQPELATYGATKFAVRGLTEALDLEWRADNIRVAAMWPLFVDTSMIVGMDTGSTRSLGVHLTAEDVAEAILETVRGPSHWLATLARSAHRPVGLQARAMFSLAAISPSWLLRVINGRITKA